MNKRLWLITLVIVLLSAYTFACQNTAAAAKLTDDEVLELYSKAREAYEWFGLTTIPFDSDKYILSDGMMYYEVVQPDINSKQALSDYLKTLFADNIVDGLIEASSDQYVEHDGKLYVLPADRGSDIFKGEETYEVVRVSDTEIKLTVTVEIYDDPMQQNVTGYEHHDFFLEFSDNRWRFNNFNLVR